MFPARQETELRPNVAIKPWRVAVLASLIVTALLATACSDSLAPVSPEPATASPAETPLDEISTRHNPADVASQRIRFERISVEHGLSQSTVNCMLQDSKGFMWFGTEDGLNKYDGHTFTVYVHDPEDPNSLGNDTVLSLYEDRSGVLWIGTRGGGLDRLDRETGQWRHYLNDPDSPDGFFKNWIVSIDEDREGTLWVGTYGGGLYQFDRQTEQFTCFCDELPPDILTVYEDRAGDLWVGTESAGLYKLDRATGQFAHYRHHPDDPHSLGSDRVTSIYEDRSGALWIGTILGGLDRLDREAERFVHYQNDPNDPHSLSYHVVASIYEDRSGTLWIGTGGGGIDRFDRATGRFTHYQNDPGDSNSLSSNTVMSIVEDRSGVLWIGTMGGGLNRVDRSTEPFRHYQSDPDDTNSLSNNVVRAIWEDQAGMLWIGTDGALDRFDRETGQWLHYREDSDDPRSLSRSASVRAILEDQSGVLWVGVFGGGLNRFDRETEHFAYYLDDRDVGSLYQDRQGVLWIGTHGEGLFAFDRETGVRRHYTYPDSLSSDVVRVVIQDRSDALWVATDGGLDRWDRDTAQWRHYRHDPDDPRSLSPGFVISAYEDRSGALWVGTLGGGLNRFDPQTGTFTHYREQDGLANDEVYGILEDDVPPDNGGPNLWLSTNNGLSKFNPRTETFENYKVHGGLGINKFMWGAYHQSGSGEMFLGGVNGFVAFHPDRIRENSYVPPIVLTSLTRDGKDVDVGQAVEGLTEVTFRWPDNAFEFEFAALSYAQPERNQYAYMLEGFDEDWIYIGTRRSGRYTNLPGGPYTLRLKGSNNDGVWNEEGASIAVTIVPPFWATGWFRGIMAVVLVGSAVGAYRLRVRSIEARSRALEDQVEERTSQLDALYRAEERMHRHLHLDQVLQALVDVAVDILQADKSAVLVWDDEEQRWVMSIARGFSPEAMAQLSYAREWGGIGRVAASGESIIVEDALTDPRRGGERADAVPAALSDGIRSFMQIPIQVGGETFGVFNVSFTEPRAFGRDERRLFLALVQRASLAIENARLYGQAQALAAVEERQRLARDLHDAVTQTLFSTSLIAEVLPRIWERNPEVGRQRLELVRQGTRSALAEMRTLLLELRPTGLAEVDLGDLLRQLAEAITGRARISVVVELEGACDLPPDVHIALYRIAQEALNNVAKHARASRATVRLRCTARTPHLALDEGERQGVRVELTISDDGRGFDVDSVPPGHLGMAIMRERAEAVGARLETEGQVDRGTQVTVVWPDDERLAVADE